MVDPEFDLGADFWAELSGAQIFLDISETLGSYTMAIMQRWLFLGVCQ